MISNGAASVSPLWNKEMFRVLTQHSGDIISLLDREGRLLYNSPAAERISGFTAEELAGVDTFQFIHPDDQPAAAQAFQRVLATPGATVSVQYRYRTKAGGWTWMEAVANNQLDNPLVRAIVANSRDITERKEAEDQRARQDALLVHRQRLEGLGTLAGGIAHEFNNLLSALDAHVLLAREASTEPEVQGELDGAHAAVRRAANLATRLLSLARRRPSQPIKVNLGDALRSWIPLLERLLGGLVKVELATGHSSSMWVRVDPSELEQVMVNLVTNARDAMPAGGVLSLALERQAGGPGGPSSEVSVLRITDSGCGIPPEVLPRVLEPFFTTKAVGKGTGLGLPISHGIISQAGGSLWIESQEGAGTTVFVSLPIVEAPIGAVAPALPAGTCTAGVGGAKNGELLLLADDDDMVRHATGRLLRRLGWEVAEARDGIEAVACVAARPSAFAAALLDQRMPNLDGPAAVLRIAEIAPTLPVLLITGYSEAEAVGTADVLQKPFDLSVLGERLRAAIDGRRKADG